MTSDPRDDSAPPDSAEPDDDGDTISWEELAGEVGERLAIGGIEGAERQARLIVMRASGSDTDEWVSSSAEPATKRGVAAIDRMTARRLAGEPLQYVLGEWSFRYLDLFVDKRVLIPRPETEVVAGAALEELKRLSTPGEPLLAADLGTGSGAIGLSLAAEHKTVEVWLTDVSDSALAVARANSAGIGRAGARVRITDGSWFDALPDETSGRFAVVVSNPPYIADHEVLPADVIEWEPPDALFSGPAGTEALELLISQSPSWLLDAGALVLEMAPAQVEPMADMASGRFGEVEVVVDLTGRERGIVARRPQRH